MWVFYESVCVSAHVTVGDFKFSCHLCWFVWNLGGFLWVCVWLAFHSFHLIGPLYYCLGSLIGSESPLHATIHPVCVCVCGLIHTEEVWALKLMFVRVCVDVCVCVVCLVPLKKCQLLSFHLSFAFCVCVSYLCLCDLSVCFCVSFICVMTRWPSGA